MSKLSRPRQLARDLLVEVGARCPADIDPIECAKERGVEIVFGELSGASARIYRHGRKARIRVSNEIQTEARRRSSIMHELGHLLLEHTLPRDGDEASWFATCCAQRSKKDERDADLVSVEGLTPTPWVMPYCNPDTVDLSAVRTIERVFRVSPVLAALRMTELCRQRCAVMYSEAGRVKWCKLSRSFPTAAIGKNAPVPAGSLAAHYFDGRRRFSDEPHRARLADWCAPDATFTAGTEIVEHATHIPEPGWGGVLSLLWLPPLTARTNEISVASDGAISEMV